MRPRRRAVPIGNQRGASDEGSIEITDVPISSPYEKETKRVAQCNGKKPKAVAAAAATGDPMLAP